jgi:hypothetical protein
MQSLTSTLRRLLPSKPARRAQSFVAGQAAAERLESREMMSVSSLFFSGNRLVIRSDNSATNVAVDFYGANIQVRDVGTNRSWTYSTSQVGSVEFQGGAWNDRFVNNVANLSARAFGFGGNDHLEGYNGADTLVGGAGNDTLLGYGGNDMMWGEAGEDVLRGMDGDDQLIGGDNNDRLNGGAGYDKLWGGYGDDVLIGIDGAANDFLQGDAGRDTVWADRVGYYADGAAGLAAEDKLQSVWYFSNGADRTLNGDRVADPTVKSGQTYRAFGGNPLFSSAGPRMTDIRQGLIGDCYFLAGLGAIANSNPNAIRQNVADFDDGTYGVRLGNNFYRVDNDLPVNVGGSTTAYASLGAQNSMWVAIYEKAFAHYRRGQNSYASIAAGWSVEVNRAFGSSSAGAANISSYASATALANDIAYRWNTFQAVTIGFWSQATNAGVPLLMGHMYTVAGIIRNAAGVVTGIRLRNPWGFDGAGNDGNTSDGFVTVTAEQLRLFSGQVNWGRV